LIRTVHWRSCRTQRMRWRCCACRVRLEALALTRRGLGHCDSGAAEAAGGNHRRRFPPTRTRPPPSAISSNVCDPACHLASCACIMN
jgi:hypothetical protein